MGHDKSTVAVFCLHFADNLTVCSLEHFGVYVCVCVCVCMS